MASWLWSVPPDAFPAYVRAETFALRRQGRARLADVRPGDQIFAYLPGRRVLAGQFEAVGTPFEDATPLAPGRHATHRLRVRPRVVLPDEARVPYDGFAPHLRVLDDYAALPPERRFAAVAQKVLHPLPAVDGKVLAFVVQARGGADPATLMAAVEAVRAAARQTPALAPTAAPVVAEPAADYGAFDRAAATERVIAHLAAAGFAFEPWYVAAYLTALRTKPFVLLAGVTGVGKSRLPVLVAQATGGIATVVPVRPDWTDPSETLGYTDLAGRFRPGALLRAARAATGADRFHTLVLDEMTLGRPEHFLAEVLSRMEARAPAPGGGAASPPLLTDEPDDPAWAGVGLPPALGLVGTLNVDEGGHALARKVLDRAFVVELGATDLATWAPAADAAPAAEAWPLAAWHPRAVRLGALPDLSASERETVQRAVDAVAEADRRLAPAGLGVGYRTRDEAALFALHASETPGAFRTRDGAPVDALDVALVTKLVPRIDGARSMAVGAVAALLGWAHDGRDADRSRAADLVDAWDAAGRPNRLPDARFPLTTARLARLVESALDDGVASFWA